MDFNSMLRRAFEAAPKLDASDGRLLLLDTYETVTGIYNHEVSRPDADLAVAGFHPAEDAHTDSLLYERIEQFGHKQVHKYFGLSLDKLLEFPRDVVLKIFEECEKLATREGHDTQATLNRLGGGK